MLNVALTISKQKNQASYVFSVKKTDNTHSFFEGEEALPLQEDGQQRRIRGAWLRSGRLSSEHHLLFAERYHRYLCDLFEQHGLSALGDSSEAAQRPILLVNFTHGTNRSLVRALRFYNQTHRKNTPFIIGNSVSSAFSLLALYLAASSPDEDAFSDQKKIFHQNTPFKKKEFLGILYEDYDVTGGLYSFGAGFQIKESDEQLKIRCLFHHQWFGAASATHLSLLANKLPTDAPSDILCQLLNENTAISPDSRQNTSVHSKQEMFWLDHGPKPRVLGTLAWSALAPLYQKPLKVEWEDFFALKPLPISSHTDCTPLDSIETEKKTFLRFFDQVTLQGDEILYPFGYALFWRWGEGNAWNPVCELSLSTWQQPQTSSPKTSLGLTLRRHSGFLTTSLCSVEETQKKRRFIEHLCCSHPNPVPWNCG